MKLFRKKESNETQSMEVGAVLDRNIGTYIRLANATNAMKAGLMGVGIIGMTSTWLFGDISTGTAPEIALVQIKGNISADNATGNGAKIAQALEDALKNENTKAILISANSGGGSPVQGEIINETIKDIISRRGQLDKEGNVIPDTKIIVSIEDVCASACLLAILNADIIYSHRNSLVGSIGVRIDGYAIDDALKSVGVERRVLTSGVNKALLDPYSNWTEQQENKVKTSLIDPLYLQFVNDVKEARGEKLDTNNKELFSGMVWTGQQGLDIGLVDEIKTSHSIKQNLMKMHDTEKVKIYNREGFSLSKMMTASFTDAISGALNQSVKIGS
jgi:protease-4